MQIYLITEVCIQNLAEQLFDPSSDDTGWHKVGLSHGSTQQ